MINHVPLGFTRRENTKLVIQKSNKKLIIITGPTAVGKTAISIELAKLLKTEIVSCDSRQFYQQMDIGTAKPSKYELNQIKHHFIDNKKISDQYTVGDYERDCIELLNQLFMNHDQVIMTGGSGLYIKAIVQGLDYFPNVPKEISQKIEAQYNIEGIAYLQNRLSTEDPSYYKQVDLDNPRRLMRAISIIEASGQPFSFFLQKNKKQRNFNSSYHILNRNREELYKRINQRVDIMMEQGLLEEAKSLFTYKDERPLQTVGYQELFRYIEGEWTLDFAIAKIKQHSRNYAKRQLTWFKSVKEAYWYEISNNQEEVIHKILKTI